MNRATLLALCLQLVVARFSGAASTNSFINFETAPIHPVAVGPGESTLAVCNVPDGRVELFDLTKEPPQHLASVPVGIDPVSVRFRTTNELWVVNYISDSINIIDVTRAAVVDLIDTEDGPEDVVFAGGRAFISCASVNRVTVFDLGQKAFLKAIDVEGDRPKALAVSPDGSKVYAAIFESGNGSTILAPRFTGLGHFPPAGVVDMPIGPYGGLSPPPNSGTNFVPQFGTNLPANIAPPRVSMIVKRQGDGRWMDDNKGDWTEFVTGTNAPFSGRVEGWQLLDHDIAVIEVANSQVSYIDSVMNICMDVAVNPRTAALAVVGTDGINEVRFEPVLQSIFTRAELGLVTSNSTNAVVVDLNSHLDYTKRSIPLADRKKAVGDPRGALWDPAGDRLFVTGMGSDNLLVLDASGKRLRDPVELPSGPTGMDFDSSRKRLYVLNRFAASVTVLDTDNLTVLETLPLFDPTPEIIKKGRPHFYDTHKSSGLGQAACASCHVDGRMDRLAWDLGTQLGKMKELTATNGNFGSINPAVTNHFHPMKGPMVTQTLQDIIGHEPFHWRGDRDGLEEFNPTFVDLQGADEELSDAEMQEFEDFLGTVLFPPNRFRNFDNSLPRNLPLKGHVSLGRGQRFRGDPLPNGDASAGLTLFRSSTATCAQCHTLPLGMGTGKTFSNGLWRAIPLGTKGQHHVALSATERSGELPFKVPQLRNLAEKLGGNNLGKAQAGFGFFHDGRVDSLTRFLQDGFGVTDDQQTANLIAFLLSFSGGDLPTNTLPNNPDTPPGDPSRDPPAALGKQLLGFTAKFDQFLARANSSTGRVELVAKALVDGQMRGWLWDRTSGVFRRDTTNGTLSRLELQNLVTDTPLLFTLVARGTGTRIGIDGDEDGQFDFDQLNPGMALQTFAALRAGVRIDAGWLRITWNAAAGRTYQVLHSAKLDKSEWTPMEMLPDNLPGTSSVTIPIKRETQGYYRIEVAP